MNKYRLSIYMGEKNQMKRSEINGNGRTQETGTNFLIIVEDIHRI